MKGKLVRAPFAMLIAFVLVPLSTVAVWPQAASIAPSHVWLYTTGIAMFRHEGTVTGNAEFVLDVPRIEIADILKSLSVVDFDGGRVEPPTYDADEPLNTRLARLPIDLSGAPTLERILQQARGQELRVRPFNAAAVTGVLVGVESRPAATAETPNQTYLVLLSNGSIGSYALAQVESISFVDARIQADFEEALALIGAGSRDQMRRLVVRFSGSGTRRVAVSYLRPAPVWKVSYRLTLPAGGASARLAGFAHIDNTSGVAWENVALSVVAGHPLAFRMDLYTPLTRNRPLIPVDTGPSIAAPVYDQEFKAADAAGLASASRSAAPMMAESFLRPQAAPAPAAPPAPAAQPTVGSALGAAFAFRAAQPVTVPRGQSAMIPLFDHAVPITRRSIFDGAVLARYPLSGVEFTNNTGLFLPAGPVTVYGVEGYLGDARVGDTVAESRQLLSFAVESGIEVRVEAAAQPEQITAIRVAEGIMTVEQRRRRETTYTATQRTPAAAPLSIVHPRATDWTLVQPTAESETVSSFRFSVPVTQAADRRITVVEEQPVSQRISLQNIGDDQVGFYLSQRFLTPAVRRALENIVELRRQLNGARANRQSLETEQNTIYRDQERIRANMAPLAQDSALYRRYAATLDQQEDRLRELNVLIERARAEERRASDALSQYISQLSIQ